MLFQFLWGYLQIGYDFIVIGKVLRKKKEQKENPYTQDFGAWGAWSCINVNFKLLFSVHAKINVGVRCHQWHFLLFSASVGTVHAYFSNITLWSMPTFSGVWSRQIRLYLKFEAPIKWMILEGRKIIQKNSGS